MRCAASRTEAGNGLDALTVARTTSAPCSASACARNVPRLASCAWLATRVMPINCSIAERHLGRGIVLARRVSGDLLRRGIDFMRSPRAEAL